MDELDRSRWIADRLATARGDAERIAQLLLRDGRITAEEVAALEAAVDRAVERGLALIGDALRESRRILAGFRRDAASTAGRGADATIDPAPGDTARRIDDLQARVAALEALVAGRPGSRGDGEGI